MDFYNRLNYSLGNEDWRVEAQALRVAPGDRVACVTASGDRPLHLLMTDCAEIVSIDMNHIQNYLLELKLTAIAHLDYEAYLAFLGCEPSRHRVSIYQQLKPYLSVNAAKFWDKNKKMIQRGIIYQGIVERLTRVTATFFRVLKHKKIMTLFSFTDLEEQREFVAKELDHLFLKEMLGIFLNARLAKLLLHDPGLDYVDSTISPGQYIYLRIKKYLEKNLARTSPLLQLLLLGKILPDAYFPYMTLDGYHKIRSNMSRLTYKNDNIIKFLTNHNPSEFDSFSMSDIASYMPQDIFVKLLQGIHSAAKPGARYCLREFLSKREIPGHLSSNFQRHSELEKKLEDEESNFVYRFFVGEIIK